MAYTAPFSGANTMGIMYNKKYFADNGLEIPKTWDEFITLCQTIKDKGDMSPLVVGGSDVWHIGFLYDLCYANDVLESDPDFIEECYKGEKDFPLFKEMKVFHIYGTLWGPIICYIAGSVAFGTLLYTSFLKGVPIDIEEAAKIDGCTEFKAFWRVVFPLLGPCTASLVVLNGLSIWNDFLMPYLALPSNQAKTITVAVYSFVGQYTARWDIVFAGTLISLVPALIIYVSLQKYFVKGIMSGAAKG